MNRVLPAAIPRVRIAIDMPLPLRDWLVAYSRQTDQSMTAVCRQALEQFRTQQHHEEDAR